MMTIKAGEFWLAEIQYTSGADAKKRQLRNVGFHSSTQPTIKYLDRSIIY
jgi:hypothetical protein